MKFAVINCEDSLKWTPLSFFDMWRRALCRSEDDFWIEVNIAKGDTIPADIYSFSGIVITGSHYNVRDDKPWYIPLVDLIRRLAGDTMLTERCIVNATP